jgi:hypothetical protein
VLIPLAVEGIVGHNIPIHDATRTTMRRVTLADEYVLGLVLLCRPDFLLREAVSLSSCLGLDLYTVFAIKRCTNAFLSEFISGSLGDQHAFFIVTVLRNRDEGYLV